MYQRVREIFALASDYRESDRETQTFFAKMQNKMHFAATGFTAAELIEKRADAKPNMGLTSWSGPRSSGVPRVTRGFGEPSGPRCDRG